jgi:beta-hydroxylase
MKPHCKQHRSSVNPRPSRTLSAVGSANVFIDDDTLFHRSVNDADRARHCLFMDIARPNRLQPVFEAGIAGAALIASSFKSIFYRNWSFIR